MKIIFFFITFFSLSFIHSQSLENDFPTLKKGDSLIAIQNYAAAYDFYKQKLNCAQAKSDSVFRAEIYYRLCQTSENLNLFPDAISYHLEWVGLQPLAIQQVYQHIVDKVRQLLPKATDSLGLTRLYYRYGQLLIQEANRRQAINYFKMAIDYAIGIKNYAATATVANELAGEYWDAGQKEESTKLYLISLEAAKAMNDSNRIAGAYLNLADNYIDGGDFKKGIPLHLEALKIKEQIADKSNLSYYYQQTAIVYYQMRNFDKWEDYLMKAYRIKDDESCTSPHQKATLYSELGGLAKHNNQIAQAVQYYDTLLQLSQKTAFWNGQKSALDNLALLYKDMGNYEKALNLAVEAEAFLTDNPYYHITHKNTIAELLQQLGRTREALALLVQNIQNEALPNYAGEQLRTFKLLYETNLELVNYKEAYRWNDSIRRLENKLRDADVRKEIAALEAKYQSEKKEQQIGLLTAENKIKNQRIRQSWLFIGFLFVLITLVLSLLFFRRKQAAFRHSELQQRLLRSQMNPHFIFNVMGSIQSYLYKNEATKAADYLSKFAALSRSVLEFSSLESVSLKEEIEMLKNYIELERAGMQHPFNISFTIDAEMETDFIEIPPMLLQPFVENAIKHGLKNLNYTGKLSLCFIEDNEYVAVEILDNGQGLPKTKHEQHKSKALEIFYQRKKGIEHRFKKELTFEFQNLNTIDQTKHGVRVFIKLPILNND